MKTFTEFQEGVAALALKGGSKLIPALITGIGAAGTIKDTLPTFMQIKNPKRSVYTGTRKSQKKERISKKSSDKTNEVAKDLGLDLTDPRQRRNSTCTSAAHLFRKAVRRRPHIVGLQHPERIHAPPRVAPSRRHAGIREDIGQRRPLHNRC